MFSQNAMNNLKNKYTAVLKKCHLLNTFGSLAVVGMLCVGAAGVVAPCGLGVQDAWADEYNITDADAPTYYYFGDTTGTINVSGDLTIRNNTGSGSGGETAHYTTTGNENSVAGKLTIGHSYMPYNTTLQADGDFAIGSVAFKEGFDSGSREVITSALEILSGTTTVSGATDINNYGTLIVNSGATYEAQGTITIENGTLTNNGTINGTDLEITAIDNNWDVDYGTMTLSGSLMMNGVFGTFDNATIVADTLDAKKLDTNPQGEVASYILRNNTTIAVNNLTGDGHLVIEAETDETKGSMLVVGSTDYQWVHAAIDEVNGALGTDLKSDALATLALRKTYSNPLDLGSYDQSSNDRPTMSFGSDSLLVVDAGALGADYAVTSDGSIKANAGAKLLISGVNFDNASEVIVNIAKADNALSIESGAWGHDGAEQEEDGPSATDITTTATENNLYFANALIETSAYTYDAQNNTYSITLAKEAADNELPLLDKSLADHLDKATDLPEYINKGIELEDKNKAASLVESAAKMSLAGGVLASLSAVNELGANAVGNRSNLAAPATIDNSSIVQLPVMLADNSTSFTDVPAPLIADAATGNGLVDGFALWVQPLYQSVSADGFKSGNFDYGYDTDIFGVSLGADYTMDSCWRFGLAFHLGGGDTESNNSDLSYTKNDFDYYGATLYSAYVLDNLSLSADIGYMVTTNDVVQKSSVGELSTGDFDAGAFSVGARAQYKVATSFVDIVPYLGARLNHSHVESFNTKDANGIVFHNESAEATTFGIPVGVTFAKTMEFEDFTLTPRAKVGVQFTMGDLDVEQRVSLPNVSGHATMESEVFDPVTFMSGVGLDFGFDDVSLALEYNLGASKNVLSQQVMATFSYKF